jgi:hypothetical protein
VWKEAFSECNVSILRKEIGDTQFVGIGRSFLQKQMTTAAVPNAPPYAGVCFSSTSTPNFINVRLKNSGVHTSE